MLLKIFLVVIILSIILLFIFKNKLENFNSDSLITTNLDGIFKTNNNIFLGFDKKDGGELQQNLRKYIKNNDYLNEQVDIDKSNLIISKEYSSKIKIENLRFDSNKLEKEKLADLVYDNGSDYLKKIISFKNKEDDVLYNHESKEIPEELCIKKECIDKKQLSMFTGNIPLKIEGNGQKLIPLQTHSGGMGEAILAGKKDEDEPGKRQFSINLYKFHEENDKYETKFICNETSKILYKTPRSNKLNKNTRKLFNSYSCENNTGRPETVVDSNFSVFQSPDNINNDLGDDRNYEPPKWENVHYVTLFASQGGGYLSSRKDGSLYFSGKPVDESIFIIDGNIQGFNSKILFKELLNKNYKRDSGLLYGIKNISNGNYLKNDTDRKWDWRRAKMVDKCNKHTGAFVSGALGTHERMYIEPLNYQNYGYQKIKARIRSSNCNRYLTYFNGLIHFRYDSDKEFQQSEWLIETLPNSCTESCKSNYGQSRSCGLPNCNAPTEENVPKELQCPIDRPICRKFNSKDRLGRCTKEDDTFNPHTVRIANKKLNKNRKINEENFDFDEYVIQMAKNKDGNLYYDDIYYKYEEHKHD